MMSRFKLKISLSFLIMGLLIALDKLEIAGNTYLSREIQNAGHFPFFGILSLLILGLLSQFLGKVILNRLWFYFQAFALTLLIGALHEYSQIIGPRDADIRDLVRDAGGAVTFLALYMIYDKKMMTNWRKWNRKIKPIIIIGAVSLIVSMIIPSALWGGAYLYRNQNFPTICGFESMWETKFLKTQDARLETILPPNKWKDVTDKNVGKLTFFVAEYPGFAIEEPYPDWSRHKLLNFTVFSELDSSVQISMGIEDLRHNNDFNDRFNRTFTVDPGLNKISIPLSEIRKAPASRDMDMSDVRSIYLFAYKPNEEFMLYFDDFRLE
ncbi:MAG: VanZ family protein [candidate division Zixibacteria bacterium]